MALCITTATRVVCMALLLLSAPLAYAEPSQALDRASVTIGAFHADPRINYEGNTNYGRIESGTFSADRATLPRLKAQLLLGDTQGLNFDYYRYDKTYNPSLGGATNANGAPLTGNGQLHAKLKLDLASLAYKWWLGSGDDVFGIGIGGAYYRARVDGTASGVLNGVNSSAAYAERQNTVVPLLELGWRHAISSELRMFAEASGIRKKGGDINGHIYGGGIGVEWYATPKVGLVVEYSASKTSLNRERSAQNLDLRLNGLAIYAKLRL